MYFSQSSYYKCPKQNVHEKKQTKNNNNNKNRTAFTEKKMKFKGSGETKLVSKLDELDFKILKLKKKSELPEKFIINS